MPDEADSTRKGKIASLPLAIRSELNRRLDDGQRGPQILPWLNGDPAVLEVLDRFWGEQPINAQNLSEWRAGGYREWVRRREKVESLKELSAYALKLGEAAGGSVADGSAAIAGGKIMELLETAEEEDLSKLVSSLFLIRAGDLEKQKIDLRKRVLTQRDEVIALAKQKFRRQTCELFLKWYDDKRAREIIEGRGSNAEKIEQLGQTLFGEDW